MPTASARLDPAEAEKLCLLGVDAMTLYGLGDPPGVQASDPGELARLAEGVLLASDLLVLLVCALRESSVGEVHRALREMAGSWRKVPS